LRGDSQSAEDFQPDIRELGSAGSEKTIDGCSSQTGERRTNVVDASEGRDCKGVKMERDILNKATAYFALESVSSTP